MTIHRLLQNIPLEPEDIDRLVTAYEEALRALGLSDRGDPMTLIVAKAVSTSARPAFAIRRRFPNSQLKPSAPYRQRSTVSSRCPAER